MRHLFFLVFLMPLLLQASAQDIVLLNGSVVDPRDGTGISEANIRIYFGSVYGEKNVVTGETGEFEITSDILTPNKDYPISIFKEGYYNLNGTVRLNYGKENDRVFKLYARKQDHSSAEVVQADPSLDGAPTNNLIFLVDVSGSMAEENRLEDLKESLKFLIGMYRPEDQISIVTYSSDVDLVLEKGSIAALEEIESAISELKPTGKTEGVAGLVKAYEVARAHYLEGGNNKVIMATDGVFAEDKRSRKLVEELIIQGLADQVTLSILSFGEEAHNVQERLADWSDFGRGRYAHIRTAEEAKEMIVVEAGSNRP